MLIIAEIGINHDGNMNLAHELIRQAAMCGADVAKFQAYSVDALFGPNGADPNDEIYKGVKPLEFNEKQFVQLKIWCEQENIEFMCSVFDEERLGWMEKLGVKRHKIASRTSKLTRDLALKMIETGKPCYMSLGFNSQPFDKNYPNLHYLYCIAEYPTEYNRINMPNEYHANYNPELDEHIEYEGFSDHSLGIEASLVAVGKGATIIEKHFTLDKSAKGFDHICSVTPDELRDLVKYSRLMEKVANYLR